MIITEDEHRTASLALLVAERAHGLRIEHGWPQPTETQAADAAGLIRRVCEDVVRALDHEPTDDEIRETIDVIALGALTDVMGPPPPTN